eukprot:SAG22_NODE_12114_length_456_cov_0.563025_2_plen_37_part_01
MPTEAICRGNKLTNLVGTEVRRHSQPQERARRRRRR